MDDFADQVAVWVAKVQARTDNTLRDIILGVAGSLVTKSPIGDPTLWASKPPKGYEPGHFIAQWQCGVGAINRTVTDEIDPSGETSMLNVAAAIDTVWLPGSVVYITNSVPYALRLENGWSSQAPAGMVGLTVIEWQGIVKNAVIKNANS